MVIYDLSYHYNKWYDIVIMIILVIYGNHLVLSLKKVFYGYTENNGNIW